jgi:hypothetical protein
MEGFLKNKSWITKKSYLCISHQSKTKYFYCLKIIYTQTLFQKNKYDFFKKTPAFIRYYCL